RHRSQLPDARSGNHGEAWGSGTDHSLGEHPGAAGEAVVRAPATQKARYTRAQSFSEISSGARDPYLRKAVLKAPGILTWIGIPHCVSGFQQKLLASILARQEAQS